MASISSVLTKQSLALILAGAFSFAVIIGSDQIIHAAQNVGLLKKGLEAINTGQVGQTEQFATQNGNLSPSFLDQRGNTPISGDLSTPSPTVLPTSQPIIKVSGTKTPGTIQNRSTGTSGSSASSNSGNCIITLFGTQYDVTRLQITHSGGNIFVCGTDQTALYQSQHGSNVARMQSYRITGSSSLSPTGLPASTSPGSSGGVFRDDD